MKQLRGAIAFALLLAATIPAAADTRLEGRYAVSIAGLTLGTAAIVLDVRAAGGRLVPQSYAMTAESQKKTDEVRMAMANGFVRDFSAVPPLEPEPDRVPLSEAHLKGVLDPLSAALFIVP